MHPDDPQTNPEADEATPLPARPSLLEGRRKFVVGTLGVTTFAATLRARPAFANIANWGSWAQQQACSPNPSHSIPKTVPTSRHCDYYMSNTFHWGLWKSSWSTQTFSNCGWSPPSGCGMYSGEKLLSCLSPAYTKNVHTGHYAYNSSYNSNLPAWVACGFLCAENDATAFGYSRQEFATLCTHILTIPSCSMATAGNWLCTALISVCTLGALGSSGFAGGSPSCLSA